MAIIRKEVQKQPKGMSTLGLTPGTPTMRTLEAAVEQWIEETLHKDQEWGHLHIELSRTSVPVSITYTLNIYCLQLMRRLVCLSVFLYDLSFVSGV